MARDPPDGPVATERWQAALRACFTRRLRPLDVDDALQECHKRHRLAGKNLAVLLLRCGIQTGSSCDPLLLTYTTHFLASLYLQPADLLEALLDFSPFKPQNSGTDVDKKLLIPQPIQESIFALLSSPYVSGQWPKTEQESSRTFRALLAYVQAYNAFETVQQIDNPDDQAPDASLVAAYEHLGAFLVILLNNINVRKHLIKAIPKGAKANISSSISHFATTLSQWSHQSPINPKLQIILKMPPLVDQKQDGSSNFTAADIAMEVVDLPRTNSRCAVYAYVNAALCHRPLVDDVHILSFLQTRYGDDHQSMVCDLITGAFDALINVLHRHEPAHTILCHRSFITNKLHSLISSLAINQLYQPGMTESCIQLAVSRIDTHPFPPLSSDSAGINEVIRDVRQEFVLSCQLHQIISDGTASAIFNGTPPKPPGGARPNKQGLLNQLISNPQKADDLVNELDKMHGDAGTISAALVESVRHFAASKETMSLKALCTAVSRKLSFVDIILQHSRLTDFLLPLCTYLNDWAHDEDQSELQPAYEDFATILLFTFALIHRYDVSIAELESYDRESFIVKYLARHSQNKHVKDLTEDETKILGKWLKGLFAVDEKGESSGITDETMSGCSPQQFYLLVPTLFEQIVLACRSKHLASNTLKGGLEFLLEPFLLPSLVGGCVWLSNHALIGRDIEIVLSILLKLLKPASISGDAHTMHTTILGTLYQELRPCLNELDKRVPNRKDIPQLIATLKPHAASQYSATALRSELREWVSGGGTLKAAMSDLVTQLTTWSNNSDMINIPTKYNHRLVEAVVEKHGADDVLKLIIDNVSTQTAIGFGSWALDVATCLMCAPNPYNTFQTPSPAGSRASSMPMKLTLRQALKQRSEDARYLLSLEQGKAETLVRLARLVEVQSTLIDMPLLNSMQMNIPTGDLMDGIDTAAAADAAAAVTTLDTADQAALDAVAADFSAAMDQNIDLTGTGGDLNMGDAGDLNLSLGDDLFGGDSVNFDLDMGTSGGAGDGQNQPQGQQSTEDDIFAGIDLGMMDDDFGF
ncbi:Mediator complex subunit Med5-like protein [Elsinoe fawcettii]|nr:Mediator complex subunit Med5-like protein [Elsinoe fawcettii]